MGEEGEEGKKEPTNHNKLIHYHDDKLFILLALLVDPCSAACSEDRKRSRRLLQATRLEATPNNLIPRLQVQEAIHPIVTRNRLTVGELTQSKCRIITDQTQEGQIMAGPTLGKRRSSFFVSR